MHNDPEDGGFFYSVLPPVMWKFLMKCPFRFYVLWDSGVNAREDHIGYGCLVLVGPTCYVLYPDADVPDSGGAKDFREPTLKPNVVAESLPCLSRLEDFWYPIFVFYHHPAIP